MFAWFFALSQAKQCVKKKIEMGILTQGHNCNTKFFNYTLSMNCKSK
jgi:hypothetical protein